MYLSITKGSSWLLVKGKLPSDIFSLLLIDSNLYAGTSGDGIWIRSTNTMSMQISSPLKESKLVVYPNPSNGTVFIQSEKDFKLAVTDITGKLILDVENAQEIDLPKGLYLFRFWVNQSVLMEKVIVW